MAYMGALIADDETGGMIIRYSRSLYSHVLISRTKIEVKTDGGWISTEIMYDKENDIWLLKGLPHRHLTGLIVRTEEIV